MYELDLNRPLHAHFIGIGGISMSGIAELFIDKGFTVSGSDLTKSEITERLENLGAKVFYEQEASNITSDIELVIYTAAIHDDNPEFIAVKKAGIPMLDRAGCLGQIMSHYKNAVAVAGTHGKTTTTSMLSQVYLEAGLDPTISVGGILHSINGNMRIGNSENFIMEACEYADSFLKFTPTTEIILNIEPEHLDYFGDFETERASFRKFINILPETGLLIINSEIEGLTALINDVNVKTVTYGHFKEGASCPDYSAVNISYNGRGFSSYDLIIRGENKGRVELSVTGEHNVYNSLAVLAASLELSETGKIISLKSAVKALKNFTGTDRRFQYKGKFRGCTVVDDYAHHPTEIAATIKAARKTEHKRLIIAFQPHLYSRTKSFLTEFAEVLSKADIVVLADIYAAREADPGDISSLDIKNLLEKKGCEAYYFKTFKEIENFLINNFSTGDLLITMGAGNIVKVGENILK